MKHLLSSESETLNFSAKFGTILNLYSMYSLEYREVYQLVYCKMIRMTWPQYRRGQCTIGDFVINLSPLEAELLSILLIRYPGPMMVGELIEAVYPNPDTEPEWAASVVTKGLRNLARKVGAFRLEFVQHVGYRLCQVPDDVANAA